MIEKGAEESTSNELLSIADQIEQMEKSLVNIWKLIRLHKCLLRERREYFPSSKLESVEEILDGLFRWIVWIDHALLDEVLKDRRFVALMRHFQEVYATRNSHMLDLYQNDLRWRRTIEKNFSHHSFFAHGGYASELHLIVKDGGLMSPIARINTGSLDIKKQKVPRWKVEGIPRHPDATAVFFYPWQNNNENVYPGAYSATGGDPRGVTDMVIFAPALLLAETARSMIIKDSNRIIRDQDDTGEVAFTNSTATETSGRLTQDNTDNLCIPLAESYIVIGKNNHAQVSGILQAAGLNDDWQREHVLVLDRTMMQGEIDRMPDPSLSSYAVLRAERDNITHWLNQRTINRQKFHGTHQVPIANHPYLGFDGVFAFNRSKFSSF